MTADAVGGVWEYALDLARWLTARDVQVLVAIMGPEPTAAQRADAAAIPGLLLHAKPYALEWMPDAWADVDRAADWLLGLADEYAPDVVHLNGYAHAMLPWNAPVLVVAHSCVYSWWYAVHGTHPPAAWEEYHRRVTAGLRAVDAVVAPSHAMARSLYRCYGITRHVQVIANSRDATAWHGGVKEPFVFAAGRVWDPAKNLATLDAASLELPWPVVIAGDDVDQKGQSRRLSHARAAGVLPMAHIRPTMARAAIYAFPALYEPFGLSVLEAALSDCALVLGDIPALRENWDGAACFVDPRSADDLRHALRALIDDPAARAALGAAARQRAEIFSPARQVEAYLNCYSRLVTHGGVSDSARSFGGGRAVAGGPS
jgi:glycogen synthase